MEFIIYKTSGTNMNNLMGVLINYNPKVFKTGNNYAVDEKGNAKRDKDGKLMLDEKEPKVPIFMTIELKHLRDLGDLISALDSEVIISKYNANGIEYSIEVYDDYRE